MNGDATRIGEFLSNFLQWLVQNPETAINKLFVGIALLALLLALFKVKEIKEIVIGIREARSPLWDLRSTVDQLHELKPIIADFKTLEPSIRRLSDEMGLLTNKIDANTDKIDANSKKILDLQLDGLSGRTEETAETESFAYPENNASLPQEDYWEQLQEYWRRNTRRLEYAIETIPDGRTRAAVDRMSRTNFKEIIDRLEKIGQISKASANVSKDLIDLFNRYRPRNRKVTSSVVEPLRIVDKQLDEGIVPYDRLLSDGASQSRNLKNANQSGGFFPATATEKSAIPTDKSVALQRC